MPANIYHKEIILCQFECDRHERLRPGTALRHAQQISTDHCASCGIDGAVYDRTHTAFVLAKLTLRMGADARVGDRLLVSTRPYAPQRAIFHRDNVFAHPDGSVAASVSASWVLIDTQSRRILRRPPAELGFPFDEETPARPAFALDRPDCPLTAAGSARAGYSTTDANGHLNNAAYADLACDALPLEELDRQPVRELSLAFHKELPFGQAMDLFRGPLPQGGWYVLGLRESERIFEANLRFSTGEPCGIMMPE